MTRFIPKNKMSKKDRKKLDDLQRRRWEICPATRIKESGKLYSRKRQSRDFHCEWICGIIFMRRISRTNHFVRQSQCVPLCPPVPPDDTSLTPHLPLTEAGKGCTLTLTV